MARQAADHVVCRHCRRRFRAVTYLHLRNIHGYDGEHPILDYKAEFDLRYATCYQSRKKVSIAKEAFWDERGQHWTRKKVIAEIRRIHGAGKTVRPKNVPVRLGLAGRRLFGSYRQAVEAAGLDYERATGLWRWTPERVVEAIRNLGKRGIRLSQSYVKKHQPTLFRVAVKRFSHCWAKALAAAGFNPQDHREPRGRWTRRRAEEWVKNRLAKGRSILACDAPRDLLDYFHKRKVAWVDFVESLGVRYPGIKKRRDWSKATLIVEIQRRAAEGRRMTYRAVADDQQALIHQARKYFGGWDRARAAAGA